MPKRPDEWPPGRPDHGSAAAPLSDRGVQRLVVGRLTEHAHTALADIRVEVQNRVVILEGTVRSAPVRLLAHQLAWNTTGVFDVSNRLAVAGEETPRNDLAP
ncbi:BON domain-containing protein [Spirilliplanes yamanashiensis]|nr:BON domain-containing protein [Spirilliplanes yamanashiensis]MDP9815263.1 osmotically-inducible protein OsmY [Spirilliplanes yamanashiensis]